MSLPIIQPFPQFFDLNGTPLDNGYVYIGVSGDNPETAPISIFWDSAMTQPAQQPLRTVNGYIARSGTPATVFIDADEFSCLTKRSNGTNVIYSSNVTSVSVAAVADAAASAAAAAASAVAADASADAAAATAASILTAAEMEDYLSKIRTPIGAVLAMAQGVVPYGYLECDGAQVSRTAYADLFAKIGVIYGPGDGVNTFNVPDLRAEFIRGWDHGRAIDTGRVIGSAQASQNLLHDHLLQIVATVTGGVGTAAIDRRDTPAGVGAATMDNTNKALNSGGSESRPRNVAMMFVIKAFDAPLQSTPPHETVTESTTARTLSLVDAQKYIRCTNAAAVTITVPANTSVPFAIDTEIDLFMAGAGTVSVVAAGGVTINAAGLSISGQYRAATLKKIGTDAWDFIGSLV